ncbi:MAG: hypothetical protein ACRDVL_00710 [Acidimicrobiia bacterium]
MTHRAPGPSLGAPKIWLLPLLLIGALAVVVWRGYLSRSLLLDFVAWWPVWLGVAVIALAVRGRRVGRVRLSGIVPLVATAAIGIFVAAHLLGWAIMPSADQVLVGPPADGIATAALSARVDGDLHVAGGAQHLYRVEPLRLGGEVGVPDADEQKVESAVVIQLTPEDSPGLYGFSGWDVALSPLPQWSLTLEGDIEADLTALSLSGVRAEGSGSIALGGVDSPTPVSLFGVFSVVVASGTPIRVVGAAAVPGDWESLSDGSRSPAPGNGWVVSVADGSQVTVVYQQSPQG